MTTDPSPIQHAAPRTATTRPWTWPLRVGLMTVFLLFVVGGPIEQLLLGWIYFPIRVLPRMVIDWPTAILGLVSSIAFVAGLHFTIRGSCNKGPSQLLDHKTGRFVPPAWLPRHWC